MVDVGPVRTGIRHTPFSVGRGRSKKQDGPIVFDRFISYQLRYLTMKVYSLVRMKKLVDKPMLSRACLGLPSLHCDKFGLTEITLAEAMDRI
jgi:hypothetical protein